MEDYLPARKSCMSTCYAPDEEAEEPMSQDSIDRWADYITCGSECVEDSGNADLEWL